MIIFLYGLDSYRQNEKLRELIAPYDKKYKQTDMLTVDFEENENDWVKARDFLGQPSLFVSSKILIIKEIGAIAEANEREAAKYLKTQTETKDIFVFVLNSKMPKKLFHFLSENSYKKYFFDELKDRMLEVFLKEEAKKKSLAFEPAALTVFTKYINGLPEKSWQAVNELEKIRLLVSETSEISEVSKSSEVSVEDVKKIIKFSEKAAVFDLAGKVLRSGALKDKLTFLERLLAKADSAYAFNSLAYQVWNKEAEQFADYDVSVKSVGLEYEEALLEFIVSGEVGRVIHTSY